MNLKPDSAFPQFENKRGGNVPANMLDHVGPQFSHNKFGLFRHG